MELIELPHLSVGAPAEITVPCISKVEMCDFLEAASGVKTSSQFVRECLVVDKAICPCRKNRPFVQVHRLELASLDTGDLGPHQRGAILEVLRTIRRPSPKVLPVLSKCLLMLGVWVGAHRLAPCGAAQAGIEMALRLLKGEEGQSWGSRVPFLHVLRRLDR